MATCTVALLAFPAASGASITCSQSGDTVTVDVLPATGNYVPGLFVGAANQIMVGPVPAVQQCDAATTLNTNRIVLRDNSPGAAANIDLSIRLSRPFAPGASAAGEGNSPEIEFTGTFGPGRDILSFFGDADPNHLSAGGSGLVNLNANEPSGVDSDMTLSGVDAIGPFFNAEYGGAGNDTVRANGGAGTGGSPLTVRIGMSGGPGDDLYISGTRGDYASGQQDDDRMYGARGRDTLYGAEGDDTVAGGPGRDLRLDGESGQDVVAGGAGRDEFVFGGPDADVVRGKKGSDGLYGGSGPDRLIGGRGFDVCHGGRGRDTYRGCERIRS